MNNGESKKKNAPAHVQDFMIKRNMRPLVMSTQGNTTIQDREICKSPEKLKS